METLSDDLLLQRYRQNGDEAAFTEIVSRHLPLAYSVANRVTGRPELSKDVCQQVFIQLGKTPEKVRPCGGLVAWLHCATRSQALNALRADARRSVREHQAALLMETSQPDATWATLAPHIDQLVGDLKPDDRCVVLLRYYEGQSLRRLANTLGITEESARKRSVRALDRLRAAFAKRGIATSSAALASLLPVQAVTTAPAGLGSTICALVASSPAVAAPFLFVPTVLTTIMTTNTKIAIVTVATLLATIVIVSNPLGSRTSTATAASKQTSGQLETGNLSGSLSKRKPTTTRGGSHDTSIAASLAELKTILALTDLNERSDKLSAYTENLNTESFGRVVNFVTSLGESHLIDVDILVRTWLERDPAAALTWKQRFSPDETMEALAAWTKNDPTAALEWAKEAGRDRIDGNPFMRTIIDNLPESPDRLKVATELALSQPNKGEGRQAMIGASRLAGKLDVEPAISWIKELPADRRADATTNLSFDLAEREPKIALDFMRESGFLDADDKMGVFQVLRESMEAGKSEEVRAYINALPAGAERELYEGQFAYAEDVISKVKNVTKLEDELYPKKPKEDEEE